MSLLLEADAAKELGVSRETVRSLRTEHLFENEHWKKKGRDLALTPSGLERLRGLVASMLGGEGQDSGPQKKDAPAASQAPIPGVVTARDAVAGALAQVLAAHDAAAAPDTDPSIVTATVTRLVPNKHLVMAVLPTGEEIRVWVRSSKNFTPGMTLRATQRVGALYDLVGNCPRFRGRF